MTSTTSKSVQFMIHIEKNDMVVMNYKVYDNQIKEYLGFCGVVRIMDYNMGDDVKIVISTTENAESEQFTRSDDMSISMCKDGKGCAYIMETYLGYICGIPIVFPNIIKQLFGYFPEQLYLTVLNAGE